MGDLVEGVGDEVLLFGVFLIFSTCAVIGLNCWRDHDRASQRNAQSTGQGGQQDDGTPRQTNDSTPPTQTQGSPAVVATATAGSQLRSRFNPTATSTGASESSRDVKEEPKQEPEQKSEGEGEGGDESLITVRLILYGSTTKPVRVSPTSTLADMRRTHFQQELSDNRPVKFIYQGRVLNSDTSTLQQLDITDGCPVHVHIGRPRESPQQRAENEQQQNANEFLDLSRFFVPLFGVILGIAWVALLCYPHIFTLITKLFLFFLSIGYVLLTYLTSFA